jgi:hypothetical protein
MMASCVIPLPVIVVMVLLRLWDAAVAISLLIPALPKCLFKGTTMNNQKTFTSICEKYNFEVPEMIKYIKENKIQDAADLCSKISYEFNIEMSLGSADHIMKHHSEYCDSCGEPYTHKDMDGGRCLSCGTMIC